MIHGDGPTRRIDILAGFTEPAEPHTRHAFTAPYERVRTWLGRDMRSAGLTIRHDGGANPKGVRSDARAEAPAWMLGSRIDKVPTGGRFDGAAGDVDRTPDEATKVDVLLVSAAVQASAVVHCDAAS